MSAMFANVDHPELVTSVHAEYVDAGVDVVTTNTFTLTPYALAPFAREGELATLLHAAARCASDAVASTSRSVLIAGCLPPLGECYKAECVGDANEMVLTYSAICAELAPRVDLFLAETLTSSTEVIAARKAAGPSGKPFWASLTLKDECNAALRGGETVYAALAALKMKPPAAILFNCCAPQAVLAGVRAARAATRSFESFEGTLLGGYANGFQVTTSEWLSGKETAGCTAAHEYDNHGIISPAAYREHALSWVKAGAGLVGGCCGVGPAHLRELCATLRRL
uniref:Hcy-binding domain-containing protein n=1 Tax=Chrysotila carterae TaxID=13221 RepID=A0A7S4B2K5_CHRCT